VVRPVYVRLSPEEEAALAALSRAEDRPFRNQLLRLIREGLLRAGYLKVASSRAPARAQDNKGDPQERVLRARAGGYGARARHSADELLGEANRAFRSSFSAGHECAVCPAYAMPSNLPSDEVARRSKALRRLHFTRLALKSALVRARKSR
jgi:hypothetical protein